MRSALGGADGLLNVVGKLAKPAAAGDEETGKPSRLTAGGGPKGEQGR